MKRPRLANRGRILDIPMRVTFADGHAIISLIEHKSNKKTFSIYTLAHYTLDMAEKYPDTPIIPIVVFGDATHWRKDVQREIQLKLFDQTWLYFTYSKVKIKDMRAADYLGCDNPILHILSPLMDYPYEDRFQVAADAYINLKQRTDPLKFRKYMDFIDKYAKIKPGEKAELLNLLTHRQEGIMLREALLEEGKEIGGIEATNKILRALLNRGMDPQDAAEVTEVSLDLVLKIRES